jgi:membrane-associated phospholipid phosphatase
MAVMRPSSSVILLAVLIVGFVVFSVFAAATDRFPGDLWIAERLQDIDSTAFARVVDITEDIGDDPIVIGIWIAAGLAFALIGGLQVGLLFALAGGLRMLNPFLKQLIGRPRPSADLLDFSEQPSTMSFPSGHSATAIVLFGLIFYFSGVYVRNSVARIALQAGCVWMILVVGIERVYAGAHWPSDVLGGYWFGAIIVIGIVILHRYLLARRRAALPRE